MQDICGIAIPQLPLRQPFENGNVHIAAKPMGIETDITGAKPLLISPPMKCELRALQ
jgi:hypothetical protein